MGFEEPCCEIRISLEFSSKNDVPSSVKRCLSSINSDLDDIFVVFIEF
jgi:hypothetical protein